MGHGCGPLTFLFWSVLRYGRGEVLLSSRSVLVTKWPYLVLMLVFGEIACAPLVNVPGGVRAWSRLTPGSFLPRACPTLWKFYHAGCAPPTPKFQADLWPPRGWRGLRRGSRCITRRVNPGESRPQAWKAGSRMSEQGMPRFWEPGT